MAFAFRIIVLPNYSLNSFFPIFYEANATPSPAALNRRSTSPRSSPTHRLRLPLCGSRASRVSSACFAQAPSHICAAGGTGVERGKATATATAKATDKSKIKSKKQKAWAAAQPPPKTVKRQKRNNDKKDPATRRDRVCHFSWQCSAV